jgi:putative PIN family toxin of toxin-antitoxin system
VVIDPNVWVAGLINPYGTPARLIDAVTSEQITAVATQHLLDELSEVLLRPKFRRWISIADAVAFVETLGRHADLYPDLGSVVPQVRDPDDDYLVALADAASAILITGDADILDADLKTPAITPRDLLTRIT